MSLSAGELELLARGCEAMRLELTDGQKSLLGRYLDLLYLWNPSAGLTAVTRDHAVRRHLLDALAVVHVLPKTGRIADLGSGGGLPGIPIAIAVQGLAVSLVETRRKKCTFLTEAVRTLGLANCTVLERDARSLHELVGTFDIVVARAFSSPKQLLEMALPLLRVSGRLIIMGARRDALLDDVGLSDRRVERVADEVFELPGGNERRRLVILSATSSVSQMR